MFYSQPVPGPLPQAFSKEPLHRYNVIFDTEELCTQKARQSDDEGMIGSLKK